MTANDLQRLGRFGLTQPEIDALHLLWPNDAIEPLLDYQAKYLRIAGFGPVDTYEAIYHELPDQIAVTYMATGLTAHQAHVITNDERARRNLNRAGRTDDEVRAVLATPVPRQYLVNVLIYADSPQEADDLLRRYTTAAAGAPVEAGDTPKHLVDTLDVMVGLLAPPDAICDCP